MKSITPHACAVLSVLLFSACDESSPDLGDGDADVAADGDVDGDVDGDADADSDEDLPPDLVRVIGYENALTVYRVAR